MQSAEFLSAVFFYLKVGENLNQNWIVENLNNAFSTWNGKLGELWGLVTTGPQTFKGGAVWSVMQTLHNGMVGIGYALVVLFFAISLCKNTMNFHELKRPEAAIHYFLRFVAAKALVGYGMDIMLNVFSICNGIVTDMADSMGGISEAMVSLPAEMQTAIENVGFLASIPLWLVTILGSLFITVLSFVMILTVYAIVSCVGVLLISAPGAYVLSRWKFVGGKAIRIGLVIAMSVPTIMIIMPLYSLAVQWGIKGRVLLVVLYIMLRVPYTTVYLLDFFSSLSRSYEEAAYIDGCSHSRTFWQIMLPLVQPAIITVTIFNFMSVWNEFFMALIFTTSDSMTPVGVGLLQIVNAMKYSGQYGAMFAAVIIVFLPTFLLYLFLSEKIIVGATSGGVKG